MEAVPTAKEVYERLTTGLHPVLNAMGMQRVSRLSYPCWVLQERNREERVFLSLQVDDKATDTYAGGGFRLELEKSPAARPASGLKGRAMFFQLLTSRELADLLTLQNSIIQALPRPPTVQVEAYPSGRVREEYLSWFEPQKRFDPIRSWLRYRSVSDVDAWVSTLRPIIGEMVHRAAEHVQRGTLHLGRGSLVEARP